MSTSSLYPHVHTHARKVDLNECAFNETLRQINSTREFGYILQPFFKKCVSS